MKATGCKPETRIREAEMVRGKICSGMKAILLAVAVLLSVLPSSGLEAAPDSLTARGAAESDQPAEAADDSDGSSAFLTPAAPGSNGGFLGVVEEGSFRMLSPHTGTARLTRIQMQEARTPESEEVNLTDYEGRAIMVSGHDGGGWIYSAEVIDVAGPILTAMVRRIFGLTD